MLISLSIRNYAIIDDLTIEFDKGLSILTGETGSGKSILLGALGLVMGDRADTTVLFDKDEKCIVEAQYDIRSYHLKPFFQAEEIDYEDICIVRREINASGKSRAFINDLPVRLETMRALSSRLLDLHQQFDILEINQEDFQVSSLDSLGGNILLAEEYNKNYSLYKTCLRNLDNLRLKAKNSSQEMEFIRFHLSEFEGLNLKAGELNDLESELNRLLGIEDIKRTGSLLYQVIEDADSSIISSLQTLSKELSAISNLEPRALELYERMLSTIEELRDMASTAYNMSESEDFDPQVVEMQQQRLNTINRLLNKHNVMTDEDLIEVEKQLRLQLNNFENTDQEIEVLEKETAQLEKKLLEAGRVISKNRKEGARLLEESVNAILASLSMKNARLKVEILEDQLIRRNGINSVGFLFSANKGSSFLPVSKVASGGELSRLNLAIKSTIAGVLTLPTLIFDEIDSGVSGQVSLMMGAILKRLAVDHQTICITHSPQIAARADAHYHIYKTERGERTYTHVTLLSEEERKIEIAKMLSGDPPSNEALDNAKQLLEITI